MRVPRFFTRQTLETERNVTLEQPPSHHLMRVLRVPPGSEVLLFNGNGCEYRAEFIGADGKQAQLRITGCSEPRRESRLKIRLGQGVSRGERMDLVMQKAVELGVQEITPLWTQRSQVQLSGKRLEKRLSHWGGIITAACEQSGRVRLAELRPCERLADWIDNTAAGYTSVVLSPRAEATLADLPAPTEVRVLIGPEGGLDTAEIQAACAAGFQAVRMGPRILRTETAAMATLAAMQALWGDFRD